MHMTDFTVQQLISEAKKEIVEIDVLKVAKILQDDSQLIVDVREPAEYSAGHIEGAINVPRGVLEFKTDSTNLGGIPSLYDKSAEIILYCKSGARSALAAQSLKVLGFKAVSSMAGGFVAWESAGLPVVAG